MPGQRLRRWPGIETALDQCFAFADISLRFVITSSTHSQASVPHETVVHIKQSITTSWYPDTHQGVLTSSSQQITTSSKSASISF